MNYNFFAMMSRMKYISRWALMRNSREENISEHSLEVAMFAHALAVISNRRLRNQLNVEKAALLGIYHDSTEIITGDMPTPIKYFNQQIQTAFKDIEQGAANKLLSMLPSDLMEEYEPLFLKQEDDTFLWRLVKAADKLSALTKCIEERKAGNTEFLSAENTIRGALDKMELEEVKIFLAEMVPAYEKNLDEIK